MSGDTIIVYCPDCRGKFEIELDDVEEGDVVECPLCMAEMEILQREPLRMKLFAEE